MKCELTIGRVPASDSYQDYIAFGSGKRPLVMIPGLSLQRVRPAALTLALMYRSFWKDYRVYLFDRREQLPPNYSVAHIASDLAQGMQTLGISHAHVIGISQGGMAAQQLALDWPHLVDRMVLAVTAGRSNQRLEEVVSGWIRQAETGDMKGFAADMMRQMYSPTYQRRYRLIIPLAVRLMKGQDLPRFVRQARACLTQQSWHRLGEIRCPVLVLGGEEDQIVTAQASRELAEALGCPIWMYEGLGHAAYEEAADFNQRMLTFLRQQG